MNTKQTPTITLVTAQRHSAWHDDLAATGFAFDVVDDELSLIASLGASGPKVLLIDVSIAEEFVVSIQELSQSADNKYRLYPVALLATNRLNAGAGDFDRAFGFGAMDFLLAEMDSQEFQQRIRFICRAAAMAYSGMGGAVSSALPVLSGGHEDAADPDTARLTTNGWGQLRRALSVELEAMACGQNERGEHLALIVVNIDRFGRLRAAYDPVHIISLIQSFAERLEALVSRHSVDDAAPGFGATSRTVALQEGVFAIMLAGVDNFQDSAKFAQALGKELEPAFDVDGKPIYLTACSGIALAPFDANDADRLLRHAHSALGVAKEQGTSSYQYYSADHAADAVRRLDLESRLRAALEADEFELYYQPQVDIPTRRIVGVEALVRWNHPKIGVISPDAFIAVALAAGLGGEIGDWVLARGIRDTARWRDAGMRRLQVSLNVTADMFKVGNVPGRVQELLDETGVEASCITLELTESMIMEDLERTLDSMNVLKSIGVRLALDDFGTGYSSLSYLKALPFDYLKIDRSFIREIETNAEDRAVVKAIVGMAKTLNMTVTVEGVEQPEQLDTLVEEGCDIYQGYLCSKPKPFNELLQLVIDADDAAGVGDKNFAAEAPAA